MSRKKAPAKPLPERGCHNCRHWHEMTETGDEERWGQCRQSPPVLHYDQDEGPWSGWPCTDPADWCSAQSPRLQ